MNFPTDGAGAIMCPVPITPNVKLRVGKKHPAADGNGYAYEHLIVWMAAGNARPARGMVIHHKNGFKTDNRYENLELRSQIEHAGEHHEMVSDEVVRTIRERFSQGELAKHLSSEFGVPQSRIYRFAYGETRRGAGGIISLPRRSKHKSGRTLDGITHDGFPEVDDG